ncbi:hypothetical protein [Crateriforma conspicua]|uniref:Uncharacterized protein n=1 Tax=Crateriforma conspicua TaxID=2527996 RepID=A0A5C5XVQ9_9PLAN|nr:hypothetical protein [Crateriforma conspicua]QDV66285.1 hypothetical protein Mal65_54610 [Crateriforma conspicua]TWT65692.1 hypothetical protein Pan14r_52410 [Crateriforma conspicua]
MDSNPTNSRFLGMVTVAMVAAFPFLCQFSEVMFAVGNSIAVQVIRTGICWLCALMIWRGSKWFRIGTSVIALSFALVIMLTLLLTFPFNTDPTSQRIITLGFVVYLVTCGVLLLLPSTAKPKQR